jgi:chromosome segregation ATPase
MGKDAPSTPPPDLMKERDEVIQSLSRGVRLTEHFVGEYTRMHDRVLALEEDNRRLRAQLEADDAMARLLSQVEKLEEERRSLLTRTQKAEKAQDQFDERFNEVEIEFASLANLYVASNQLHASLTPRGVVRRIKEVLSQLNQKRLSLVGTTPCEEYPVAAQHMLARFPLVALMEASRRELRHLPHVHPAN